jgi:hypothetical protein
MGYSLDFCVGTVSKVPTRLTGNYLSNIRIFCPHECTDLLKNHELFDLLWTHGITTKAFKDIDTTEKDYVYIWDGELTNRSVYNERLCAQSCSHILGKINTLIKFVDNNHLKNREDTMKSLQTMKTMLSSAIVRKHTYCLFIPT